MDDARRRSTAQAVDDLYRRVIALERTPGGGGTCEDWHAVGDPGEPAFENGWDNLGSPEAPVSFMLCRGWVHLRGGFAGGADDTTVFTLPAGYRPEYQQEMILPTTSDLSYATVVVGTDGQVVYRDTIT